MESFDISGQFQHGLLGEVGELSSNEYSKGALTLWKRDILRLKLKTCDLRTLRHLGWRLVVLKKITLTDRESGCNGNGTTHILYLGFFSPSDGLRDEGQRDRSWDYKPAVTDIHKGQRFIHPHFTSIHRSAGASWIYSSTSAVKCLWTFSSAPYRSAD